MFSWFEQSVIYIIPTLGLIVFPLIFFVLFFLALFLMKKILRLKESTFFLMAICTYSLVPIALAYNVAHYFSLLLVGGQLIVPLLSDPLHLGWDLFDTANFISNIGIIGAKAVWNMQVGVIVFGHVVAVILAHIAVQKFSPSRSTLLLAQLPMLVLMVLYTLIGLSILSLPMGV